MAAWSPDGTWLAAYGGTGLLKDGGKLTWPFVLRQSTFDAERTQLNEQLQQAVKQAQSGEVGVVDKHAVPTGHFAVNPFNHEKIPIWVANYVVMDYGTGAIMSVPAHDERDHEFAKKYGLPFEATRGGKETTYPEYELKIQELLRSAQSRQASQ